MYPFRNILFPTDFTAHARAALKYAAAFARQGGGRVMLFSVQSARVPANLLTLPERVFEEEQNRWLLQVRTEVRTCWPIHYSTVLKLNRLPSKANPRRKLRKQCAITILIWLPLSRTAARVCRVR